MAERPPIIYVHRLAGGRSGIDTPTDDALPGFGSHVTTPGPVAGEAPAWGRWVRRVLLSAHARELLGHRAATRTTVRGRQRHGAARLADSHGLG